MRYSLSRTAALVLMLAIGVGCAPARAYVEALRVLPEYPSTRDRVTLTVGAGECHGFLDAGEGLRQVNRVGGDIEVVAEGIALSDGDPFCILPNAVYRFDLGALPSGQYRVALILYDPEYSKPHRLVGSLDFDVKQPFVVPAVSSTAIWLLGLGIVGVATVCLAVAVPRGESCIRRVRQYRLFLPSPVRSFRSCAAVVLGSAVLLGSGSAYGYVDPPRIFPSSPTHRELIQAAVRAGVCHGFPEGTAYRLVREGNRIDLIAEGVMLDEGHPFCVIPDHEHRFDLGSLSKGRYRLNLYLHDPDFLLEPIAFGSVDFQVSGSHAIPANSLAGLVVLGLAVGAVVLRRRQAVAGRFLHVSRSTDARPAFLSSRPLAAIAVAAAILGLPMPAYAFVQDPRIEPAAPTERNPITARVRAGDCHGFIDDGVRWVERNGSQIDVVAEGVASLSPGHPFCVFPDAEYDFPIGFLPAGRYRLTIHIYEPDFFDEPVEFGSVEFSVDAPHRIPSAGWPMLAILAVGAVGFGAVVLRRRGLIVLLPFAALIGSTDASADPHTAHVLLEASADVTAADVVEGFRLSGGGPSAMVVLDGGEPSGVEFLIAHRAAGRFKDYLIAHPESPRARLERYIVVSYASPSALATSVAAMNANSNVELAYSVSGGLSPVESSSANSDGAPVSWRDPVGLDAAWSIAGGWSSVAVLDNGAATNHPELLGFSSAGRYLSGNLLTALSADSGRAGVNGCQAAGTCISSNIDEGEPLAVLAGSSCDPDFDGWAIPSIAGHGTHVAGLVAANAEDGNALRGACKHCGIAVWRISFDSCAAGKLIPVIKNEPIDVALTRATDFGAQVVNQSLGSPSLSSNFCTESPLHSRCQSLAYAESLDVLLVGASGNNRTSIQFPANQTSVLAVGGIGANLLLWDRSPGSLAQCPTLVDGSKTNTECGSNYTLDPLIDRHQEIVAPSENVLSAFYPGSIWNSALGCTDAGDGQSGDGAGLCTGTSMAAPIVSGIGGILRSINPLVSVGSPDDAFAKPGIRSVLRASTFESKLGKAWDAKLGFGRVDAAAAARAMLGTVAGSRVRNRAIPLFDFHSTEALDHASVATPQSAVSLGLNQAVEWLPRGGVIGGYPAFPVASPPATLVPRASAFVLSTEFRTRSRQPRLVPLFLLDRPRPWPLGCTPGQSGCVSFHNDHLLVSTVGGLEQAHADGYRLLGRQGYVFARCAPEPACMPSGSVKLYRQCNAADDDCAVFVESEKAAFEATGFTAKYPVGSDAVLGYVFPNVDDDGDALVDGFERLIGTNPALADSDADGAGDGVEYPLAGVPVSDPCGGAVHACDPPAFFDGFE